MNNTRVELLVLCFWLVEQCQLKSHCWCCSKVTASETIFITLYIPLLWPNHDCCLPRFFINMHFMYDLHEWSDQGSSLVPLYKSLIVKNEYFFLLGTCVTVVDDDVDRVHVHAMKSYILTTSVCSEHCSEVWRHCTQHQFVTPKTKIEIQNM